MAREEYLFELMDRLINLRNECSSEIFSECGMPDMTVTQIGYLKAIARHGDVTFSRLAEITRNSKPTISETISRFVRMECVYKEKSPDDGRIAYIRLTEKGRLIANAEQKALGRVIERMIQSLDEKELDLLVEILKKVR